jgi:hypothetical protein
MSNAEFSELIRAEEAAEVAHKADPADPEKLDRYLLAYRARRSGLDAVQRQRYAEKYPCVQFERMPDEHLL